MGPKVSICFMCSLCVAIVGLTSSSLSCRHALAPGPEAAPLAARAGGQGVIIGVWTSSWDWLYPFVVCDHDDDREEMNHLIEAPGAAVGHGGGRGPAGGGSLLSQVPGTGLRDK